MNSELLTISQTADYLQVCEKTVRRLIKSHKLTASRIGDRMWRIRKIDIDAYLSLNANDKNGVANNE